MNPPIFADLLLFIDKICFFRLADTFSAEMKENDKSLKLMINRDLVTYNIIIKILLFLFFRLCFRKTISHGVKL